MHVHVHVHVHVHASSTQVRASACVVGCGYIEYTGLQQHGAHLLDVGVEQLLQERGRAHLEEDTVLAWEVR
jgi:hypothetical protein